MRGISTSRVMTSGDFGLDPFGGDEGVGGGGDDLDVRVAFEDLLEGLADDAESSTTRTRIFLRGAVKGQVLVHDLAGASVEDDFAATPAADVGGADAEILLLKHQVAMRTLAGPMHRGLWRPSWRWIRLAPPKILTSISAGLRPARRKASAMAGTTQLRI